VADAAIELGEARQSGHEPGIRRAIVLSGGGARGAYEAGVLRYIFEKLPPQLGFVPRFQLYCGTSVGAVHACYLAAHADEPDEGTRGLVDIWREMAFSNVYRFGVMDALSFSRTLLGFALGSSVSTEDRPARIHGLLNTEPLERLVVERIPWRRLRRNIHSRLVGALTVSVTEIATGRTLVFVDNRERALPSWTRDPVVIAKPERVGPEHALASAAIPFLFPAVRVGDTYFCDGGLRQITPLTPALRLGANRVLVIGLRAPPGEGEPPELAAERQSQFLSAAFLFGKVLNAFLIDPIDYDLSHMRILNNVLRAGCEEFGPDYLHRVNRLVERERGLGFRLVEDCFIQPSQNIGTIAASHVERMRRGPRKSWVGSLALRTLTRGAPEDEADLMSYLLFDGDYASDLIELGMADAARNEEKLARFFIEEP
jgi:NTE family protein